MPIIVTNSFMSAILVACGIKTLHYTPRHPRSEVKQTIEDYNGKLWPYTCLVTTLQNSTYGLKLHEACYR